MNETPELRLVPKPDGFELRERRSGRDRDGSQWQPQDALYDASRKIEEATGRVTSVVVIWREEFEDDNSQVTNYRSAGPHGHPQLSVMNVLGRMMGWR